MTPLIVIAVLLALAIVASGSVVRRSHRDRQATRKYHRALHTLGQLNDPGPGPDRSARPLRRSDGEPALASPRPAPAQRRPRVAEAEARPAVASYHGGNGASDRRRSGDGAGQRQDGMTSSTSPAGPSGPAAEGFRILGPVSGRVTGEAPVVRARPGAPTGRVVGAPSKPAVVVEGRSGNSARRDQPAAPDDRPAVSPDRPAVPHDEPAWGAPVANRPAAGRRGIHDHDGAGDTARRPGNRGHGEAGGQGLPEELLVFDSHEPPRRTPLPAGANAATPAAAGANAATPAPGGANAAAPAPTRAKVAAPSRRAHPRPPRRGGRAAVLAGAAAIAVAGVSVGAFEVAGGSGLPSTPAAAKGPLVRHSPTVPSTTATTAPAPTTTVPPFTLVSNTNGTASYAVSGSPTVVVSAQGPCWVEAHQPNAQGNVVYAAILAPGQTETLHAPVWIRLGAPSAVTVTVNGTSLPPLVTGGAPWNLDLQ